MFNTGIKAKAQQKLPKSRNILWAARMLCTALRLLVLNMRQSAQVVLAQQKQNGSAPVPKNGMSINTNLVFR